MKEIEEENRGRCEGMKQKVTSANYAREVLMATKPVLVEFYADWCAKCAMMEDVIEELARENDFWMKVCQIDMEESKDLSEKFEVEIVPTYVVFWKAKPIAAANGVRDREALEEMVKEAIMEERQGGAKETGYEQ